MTTTSGAPTDKGARVRVGGRKSGAWLARYALEQIPVSHTFGIPGVHTTELYDELKQSERIRPVLVTHEVCGAFAADAISRTGHGKIGCLVLVPAAGVTHAMSGIGECYLDGIPVLVEIPVNLQLFSQPIEDVPVFVPDAPQPVNLDRELDEGVRLLSAARSPGLFVGWGAVDVSDSVMKIAEILGAPVSTTLQGLSAFPGNHPLHTGMGFSRAAVPAAENAFANCDCLLAIGVSFGEIPTGSFGCSVPENLIHIDISAQAVGRNFPAKVGLLGDSRSVVPELLARLRSQELDNTARRHDVEAQIAKDKKAYRDEWHAHRNNRVNPALFFEALRY